MNRKKGFIFDLCHAKGEFSVAAYRSYLPGRITHHRDLAIEYAQRGQSKESIWHHDRADAAERDLYQRERVEFAIRISWDQILMPYDVTRECILTQQDYSWTVTPQSAIEQPVWGKVPHIMYRIFGALALETGNEVNVNLATGLYCATAWCYLDGEVQTTMPRVVSALSTKSERWLYDKKFIDRRVSEVLALYAK